MFTGIITDIGTVIAVEARGDLRLRIGCGYDMHDVALGASIACSGVCLTVVEKGDDWFAVDVSGETVSRTPGGQWTVGRRLNLERALKIGDELGGHIVTGHVDGVGDVIGICPDGDSHRIGISVPAAVAPYLAAKGSITIDGVSLTVNEVTDQPDGSTHFAVNIIPHTAAVTTLGALSQGTQVNLEIDVLAVISHAWRLIVPASQPLERIRHAFLSTPEEIIEEAKNGRMFILVDDEDRENEGDLVIPAQMATPDAINFMAKYGRGLICLTLTAKRVEQLGLDLMSRNNGTRHETAFTTSIEAREGVTTGISAADRARTVSVAIDGSKGREDIVTPGHVFPLIARDGGVLVRAGHTEAAVDVARLAGLNPSGVICEIMRDDGTMARMDDLVSFAQFHNLKMGTIRDLIAYRRRHDHHVERVAESEFTSDYGGRWKALSYRNKIDGMEHIVLQKGRVSPDTPTLVRMHGVSLFNDMLGVPGERKRALQRAMIEVGRVGSGVIVLLINREAGGLTRLIASGGTDDGMDFRNYGIGAQILADLGIHDMTLLTNAHRNIVGLEGYGLNIVGEMPIPEL